MTIEYQHDAERWLRSQADLYRARYNPGMASTFRQCADEIHRLRMSDDLHQQGAEHMRDEMAEVKAEMDRLSQRDGNATIELCYNDGDNQFAREYLQIVDFGVSGNVYVVESNVVETLHAELAALKEAASQTAKKDLSFLRELQSQLDPDDTTKMDYARQMVGDWIDELAAMVGEG